MGPTKITQNPSEQRKQQAKPLVPKLCSCFFLTPTVINFANSCKREPVTSVTDLALDFFAQHLREIFQ
jgi:hypothetical protein